MNDGKHKRHKSAFECGRMETGLMKMFAKDHPWRPVCIACILFLVAGYFLYFVAYLLPTPQWGRELMTWAMPTVKALDLAARVGAIKGADPFPAQAVILYCAPGSIVLTGWCLFWVCYSSEARQALLLYYVNLDNHMKPSRVKLFFSGMVGIFIIPFLLYAAYWLSTITISGRDFNFYSSHIGSASLLLASAVMF